MAEGVAGRAEEGAQHEYAELPRSSSSGRNSPCCADSVLACSLPCSMGRAYSPHLSILPPHLLSHTVGTTTEPLSRYGEVVCERTRARASSVSLASAFPSTPAALSPSPSPCRTPNATALPTSWTVSRQHSPVFPCKSLKFSPRSLTFWILSRITPTVSSIWAWMWACASANAARSVAAKEDECSSEGQHEDGHEGWG